MSVSVCVCQQTAGLSAAALLRGTCGVSGIKPVTFTDVCPADLKGHSALFQPAGFIPDEHRNRERKHHVGFFRATSGPAGGARWGRTHCCLCWA